MHTIVRQRILRQVARGIPLLHVLHWSRWRRHHQGEARACHIRRHAALWEKRELVVVAPLGALRTAHTCAPENATLVPDAISRAHIRQLFKLNPEVDESLHRKSDAPFTTVVDTRQSDNADRLEY